MRTCVRGSGQLWPLRMRMHTGDRVVGMSSATADSVLGRSSATADGVAGMSSATADGGSSVRASMTTPTTCTPASEAATRLRMHERTNARTLYRRRPRHGCWRGYGRAATQNDRLAEAVILSTGTTIPAQQTCRWQRRKGADIEPTRLRRHEHTNARTSERTHERTHARASERAHTCTRAFMHRQALANARHAPYIGVADGMSVVRVWTCRYSK